MEVLRRRRSLLIAVFLLSFTSSNVVLEVLSQDPDQAGFITLNCGGENFTDDKTGLRYTSDATFVGDNVNGVSKRLTPKYKDIVLDREWSSVTSFPKGIRNCYTLRPTQGKLNKYLIRARFFYGNYDGNPDKQLPQFDLHLGVEYWDTVEFEPEFDTRIVDKEIIHIPSSDLVHVCLFNIGLGTPFISILELQPLNNYMYPTVSGGSLMNYFRFDIGSTLISAATHCLRYKDDVFDRIWLQWTMDGTTPVNTTSTENFERDDNLFNMPPAVMSTGVVPSDPTQPLRFIWSTNNYSDMLYFYFSFAEIQNLKSNQTRELNIYLNGNFYFGPLVPPTKGYFTVYSKTPYTNRTLYNFSFNKTQNSTLPPIINAVEVYCLKQFNDPQTDDNDVEAMFGIKSDYGVTNKNWQGDPCSPVSDSWDGLKCSHTVSNPPRITSLKLESQTVS